MRNSILLLTLGFLALTPTVSKADANSDANAGLDALNKRDFSAAVQLFTRALGSGALSPADREYAYVKRGQAYLGQHATEKANADFDQALKLNPKDREAANLRGQAHQATNGTSLIETFNYIVNKINQQGPVNYIEYRHNSLNNNDQQSSMSLTMDNLNSSPDNCTLKVHVAAHSDGRESMNVNGTLELRSINKINITTIDDIRGKIFAKSDHPEITTKTNPTIYVDLIELVGGKEYVFNFYDEDTADGVAKALNHAAELCGAGKNNPF